MRRLVWLTMMLLSLLVVCADANAERVRPTFETTEVHVVVQWFDTRKELVAWLKEKGCKNCHDVQGISLCKEGETCYIYAVRPKKVNDLWTKILGHELMHGLFGRYHEEWYWNG